MAILNKDEYFARVQGLVKEDSSDEAISLFEDLTDTYNDLATRANGSSEDWKSKYDALDKSWRAKYRSRFFSTGGGTIPEVQKDEDDDEGYNAESVTINSLFGGK